MVKKVNRFISILLTVCMVLSLFPAAMAVGGFKDVSSFDYFAEAAEALQKANILNGYPDGSFGGSRRTTRAEMSAIICRMAGQDSDAESHRGKTTFTDVPAKHWASGYINIASDHGVIEGDGNGLFRPEDPVLYEEAVAMVLRVLGFADKIQQNSKDWSAPYLKIASDKGITDGTIGEKGAACVRGDIAVIVYQGIKALEEDDNNTPLPGHKSPTVTFDLNYKGAPAGPHAQVITDNRLVREPETPQRPGYVFAGWSTDKIEDIPFDFSTPVKKSMRLFAKWDATDDKDRDGVSEPLEELLGTDPNKTDTDEDGLSDYIEIYESVTDPLLKDTDGDGVSDGDEDYDQDGLTNLEEVRLGTSLCLADTDEDGISDREEVQEYKTDPLKADTDQDGLSDGDEIVLGLDPLKEKTDGVQLDSERMLKQELKEENIDQELLDEANEAIPSLTVTAVGNANRTTTIVASDSDEFVDSRSIIGEPIEILGGSEFNGELRFQLKDEIPYLQAEGADSTFPAALICKYKEDHTISYYETTYNDGVLSADIEGDGTYYVLQVQNLFNELGLELPTVSNLSLLSDTECFSEADQNLSLDNGPAPKDAALMAEEPETEPIHMTKEIKNPAQAMAQADIVFVVDTTGSMEDEINNVRNNMTAFVDALKERGITAGFALIDYEDITVDGMDSTRVHKNGSSNWFYNVESYKKAISNLTLGYGGDVPECAVDGLETARLLDMRASAGKFFILVTDANYKVDNRYDIPSMAAEIELLKNAGVTCSVVSPTEYKQTYSPLFEQTNGLWANIYGNFSQELLKLADRIGDIIVGDGYWIYLQGPIPVPVRLDEKPYKGSTVDTDKDGIPDVVELDGYEGDGVVDLDHIIKVVSRGTITDTKYGTVKVYRYLSNPMTSDTDMDGVKDKDDSEPRTPVFKGTMLGHIDVSNVNYRLQLEDFTKDETILNKDLMKTSLIFANAAYDGGGIRFEKDNKTITDIKEFASFYGFEHIENYKSARDYKDDEISEVTMGYRDFEVKGQKYRLFGIFVRGTNGTVNEWSSNFDIGDPNTWHDEEHRGFSVTAERLYDKVEAYCQNHRSEDAENVAWVTGHSRGAAISNLIAANLIDEGMRVYAYTFATPSPTTAVSRDMEKYKSIFNIVNTSDLITYLPLEKWGFGRYGNTINLGLEEASVRQKWSEHIKNDDTNNDDTNKDAYNGLDAGIINTALNRICNECARKVADVYNRAGVQNINMKQHALISNRATRYCTLTYHRWIYNDGIFSEGYEWHPSLMSIFQMLAEMLGTHETVCEADGTVSYTELSKKDFMPLVKELWNSEFGAAFILLLKDGWDNREGIENNLEGTDSLKDGFMEGVKEGHAPGTYYILCEYQK